MAPGVGPATGRVWPPAPPVGACVSAHAPALRHGTLAHVDTCVRGGGWEGYLSELREVLRGQEREGQAPGGRVTLFSSSSRTDVRGGGEEGQGWEGGGG